VMQPSYLTNRELLVAAMGEEALAEAETLYGGEMLDMPSGIPTVASEIVEEEVFNGPDFEWRPLDRIHPDPSAGSNRSPGDPQNYRWFIEDIDTTLEEIEDDQDDLQPYNTRELAQLRMHVGIHRPTSGDSLQDMRQGTGTGVNFDHRREPQDTENIPEHYTSPYRDGTGVRLWQCWGWVPPDQRTHNIAWRILTIAEGKYILRDEPAPTPDHRPPYFAIKGVDIPMRLYGESIIKYTGPLAEQQTRLANMRLDEVFLGVWQQYLFRKDSVVSDNALLMQPGGAIEVNPPPNTGIGDTFQVLPRKPLLPDVWNEDNWRQQQAEHAAAATDIMQGIGSAGNTATEVERRLQQGNARHVLQIMYYDWTVKREILMRSWKWLQSKMTTPRMVRLQGEEYAQVDLNDLRIPIDIVVGGGMQALSKQTRQQMSQLLVELVRDPITSPYFKHIPVMKRLLQDFGWKNPDTYLKTEQEFELEQWQRGFDTAMAEVNKVGMAGAPGEGAGGPPMEGGQGNAKGAEGYGAQPALPPMPLPGQEASVAGGMLSTG